MNLLAQISGIGGILFGAWLCYHESILTVQFQRAAFSCEAQLDKAIHKKPKKVRKGLYPILTGNDEVLFVEVLGE